MRPDLLDIIACPLCRGPLELQTAAIAPADAADAGAVRTGTLSCRPCNEHYPIADGIPNLLPPELREAVAAAQWSDPAL